MKRTRNNNRNKHRKTMKGGFSPRITILLTRILNRAILFKFDKDANSYYYNLLVHSPCHKKIIKRIVKALQRDIQTNDAWQNRYAASRDTNAKIHQQLYNFLIFAGIIHTSPVGVHANNVALINYIMTTESAALDDVFNTSNDFFNIKNLAHGHVNVFDASTMDEFMSHFPEHVRNPIEEWQPIEPQLDVSPESDEADEVDNA